MDTKATKFYKNAVVITMNKQHSVVNSIALNDNKILAVGKEEELESLIDDKTEIIDLKGKTVLPGFYDPHGHISMFAKNLKSANLNSPPIADVENIEQLLAKLKEHADKRPDDEWIIGWGYDDTRLTDKRHPTRYELDKISTEKPIYISHISEHLASLNSKALEVVGYSKDTPDPEGGILQRDPVTGELNGIIEETTMNHVRRCLPKNTDEDIKRLMTEAGNHYASKGVTTASDQALFTLKEVEDVKMSVLQEEFPIRINCTPFHPLIKEMGSYKKLKEYLNEFENSTDKITIPGIKCLQDGSIQGYTAYLSKPYYVPYKGDLEYRGYPTMSLDKLTALVKEIHNNGDQVIMHTNGDAASDDLLDAVAAAQKERPRKDPRHILIHAQTVREEQLDKMKELGVEPNFFVTHIYYWGQRHKDIFLGPDRAARMNPLASALERGLTPTIHCDTPVVPQTPFLAIETAVRRKTYEGDVLGPEQRISVWDALKTYTINAAWQFKEEEIKGSIEPGKLADLVVVDENPLLVDSDKIKDIKVLETIVGGKTVFIA